MVMMVVMVMEPGHAAGRAGVLVMVMVQAEHEARGRGVPVMVAGRGVQFAAPRGHGVELAAAAAADHVADAADAATVTAVTAVTAVTDVADVADDAAAAAAQRAQRRLPRCRDRGVGVAAGRAARPVAGAGHRPSVVFRRHHRDAFRAHCSRPAVRSVRQRACSVRTAG